MSEVDISELFESLHIHSIPPILEELKNYLQLQCISLVNYTSDGRVNSSFNERIILNLIQQSPLFKIHIPSSRMWYDFLIEIDEKWMPVNIKITTTTTADNMGNFAPCVFAYTDEPMDLMQKYSNGKMSKLFIQKIKLNQLNQQERDYYFLVINKTNPQKIIVNGLKGLSYLTPNANNLPFQIQWNKNEMYHGKPISLVVQQVMKCFQITKKSWQFQFIQDIHELVSENNRDVAVQS